MTKQLRLGLGPSSSSSHLPPLLYVGSLLLLLLVAAGVGGLVPSTSNYYSCRRRSSILSSGGQHQSLQFGLNFYDSRSRFPKSRWTPSSDFASLLTARTTSRLFQQQQESGEGESSITTVGNDHNPPDDDTENSNEDDDESVTIMGTVLRTAFRKYDKENSKPSGSKYTTRKDSQPNGVRVTKGGIDGDYNHYRTLALKSTPDRAVCLWTTDVLSLLHSENYPVEIGDLGENLSLEGMSFDDFKIGHRYKFINSSTRQQQEEEEEDVVIEITERAEPCANLCKLPYINEEKLDPKQRIQKCIDLIELLNQADGLRGWYAKVIQEGFVRPGDKVVAVMEEDELQK